MCRVSACDVVVCVGGVASVWCLRNGVPLLSVSRSCIWWKACLKLLCVLSECVIRRIVHNHICCAIFTSITTKYNDLVIEFDAPKRSSLE